jgi:hypothetical protein
MSFLPLVGGPDRAQHWAMYPMEMVEERQQELHRLRHGARRAVGSDVGKWRKGAGRALASLAVAVGVPRSERATIRCRVGAALTLAPPQP